MTQTPPDLPMRALFDAQYRASRSQIDVPLALRLDRLQRMRALIDVHGAALAEAVQADFGVRSLQLTEVADFFVLRALLGDLEKHTVAWMKPRRVSTPIYLQPASAHIQRQPLGVIGVIGPWNYPLQLTLGPAATALAAGNRVMIKPSELTPHTSALLAAVLNQAFATDEVCVVQGGADVAHEFASLPFDHLFFTGSTAVGSKVAAAAAANLTPTTLELGGKSPCIIDASCDIASAAIKIAHGKLLNAGQTCIAPDYVLLPRGREAEFEQAYAAAVVRLFPTIGGNPDYTSIVSDRHHARLQSLLSEARTHGARVVEIRASVVEGAHTVGQERQMNPVLVFDTPSGLRLMREEIFGPILPVLTYRKLDDAINTINTGPRPLALYWFGRDTGARDHVLRNTVSGGVTVNDTLLHIAHDNLPFGGVGESGWGAYHGETGFLRFTQQKSVLVQSRFAMGSLFYPPYGKRFDQVMGLLKRWL
ncbi:coniferyl aldehyde dehydrogenase [Hydrogenophaga taeniospiralis]|uniref:coniferyl aldehyde dehydrogenase n=1 Tax=Hydrogenophaga taeniospiralis TaxID=65656 RepID=UPI001CFA0226|nr:coniferyl aldehyde dehydrogenase [Hydrogenophaga taeniospiralis]UCU92099.1 coniferyl aldehyde dehydrogenase [Hydrogenophaga taeniospiralis]